MKDIYSKPIKRLMPLVNMHITNVRKHAKMWNMLEGLKQSIYLWDNLLVQTLRWIHLQQEWKNTTLSISDLMGNDALVLTCCIKVIRCSLMSLDSLLILRPIFHSPQEQIYTRRESVIVHWFLCNQWLHQCSVLLLLLLQLQKNQPKTSDALFTTYGHAFNKNEVIAYVNTTSQNSLKVCYYQRPGLKHVGLNVNYEGKKFSV